MARLRKRDLERIIRRDLPGYSLLRREGSGSAPSEPDEAAADIDELRKRYLGDDAPRESDAAQNSEPPGTNTDDEIVTVTPDQSTDPFDQAARPKAVIVSGETGRVIGSQG